MMLAVTQLQHYRDLSIAFGSLSGFFFICLGVALWWIGEKDVKIQGLKQELRDIHQEVRLFQRAETDVNRQIVATMLDIQRHRP
jgi:hypothetical protein